MAKLTAELQAQKQQTQWLQDSFDSIAISEAFYKEREKKVAHLTYDGRMMAAELEMLWDRTQPSAADPMSTTPHEQLASVLQELEALR